MESRAFDKLEKAFREWAASYPGAAVPHGSGVFGTLDDDTNQGLWYFSPTLDALGQEFNAQPCEKPIPNHDFGLLVGELRSITTHFAEHFDRKQRR
jgi:hypothetical protein